MTITHITNPNWFARCANLAQKQQLFEFAVSQGVPVAWQPLSSARYGDDQDLDIRWLRVSLGPGLFSLPSNKLTEPTHSIEEFRQLCRDYVQTVS